MGGQLLEAFLLGNAAILGNVCMLPLYPGLFALLASRADDDVDEGSLRWMGVLVLAGVLTFLIAVAGVLWALSSQFGDVLPVVLPVVFGLVILLGVLLILDRNPLRRLGTGQVPVVGSPAGSAFVYGLALGPMTMPCTGPVIFTAFAVGGVAGAGAFGQQLGFFLAFGAGFGWPLVLLPLLATSTQARFTRFLTRNHRAIDVVSGVLLIGVATIGLADEVFGIDVPTTASALGLLVVAGLAGVAHHRTTARPRATV